MSSFKRSQAGFTLIEVLIVSSLFTVIVGATLSVVTRFDRTSKRVVQVNEQAESARQGLDRLARQLRNLAQRVNQPVIDTAGTDDLIFQTSDPTRTWVRYCVEPGAGPRGTDRLWTGENGASPTVTAGMRGSCPGTDWDRTSVVADGVVNSIGGRRVFTYVCTPDKPVTCPASSAEFPLIKSIGAQIFIDPDPANRPVEHLVSSGVFLRNQNEDPTASFSWTPTGPRKVALNAAGSQDPEGRTLRFYWYAGTAPDFTCAQGPPPPPAAVPLEGVHVSHTFPDTAGPAGTVVPVTVVVCDPGDLQARYTEGVTIPS